MPGPSKQPLAYGLNYILVAFASSRSMARIHPLPAADPLSPYTLPQHIRYKKSNPTSKEQRSGFSRFSRVGATRVWAELSPPSNPKRAAVLAPFARVEAAVADL
eukprot:scaffold184_cov316-Pinguiococcus_pyrenoidosus.AAC.39